ncbi:MAG: hypothetical protein JXD22_10165 [Sedimentisphaerales bacterium]|nr:hypothetical protein [Sedimentisphaerales bacterium]
MSKKTGPKGNYIKDSSGVTVVGLCYYEDKKTKKAYHYTNYTDKNTGKRKRQHFSKDRKTAIKQFEIWKSAQEGDKPIKKN